MKKEFAKLFSIFVFVFVFSCFLTSISFSDDSSNVSAASQIKPFGISWDSTPNEAKAFCSSGSFQNVNNREVLEEIRFYYLKCALQIGCAVELENFNSVMARRSDFKKAQIFAGKNINSNDFVQYIAYIFWNAKLMCSIVGTSSDTKEISALDKYGKPIIVNEYWLYYPPIDDHVVMVSTDKNPFSRLSKKFQDASIMYHNLGLLKEFIDEPNKENKQKREQEGSKANKRSKDL